MFSEFDMALSDSFSYNYVTGLELPLPIEFKERDAWDHHETPLDRIVKRSLNTLDEENNTPSLHVVKRARRHCTNAQITRSNFRNPLFNVWSCLTRTSLPASIRTQACYQPAHALIRESIFRKLSLDIFSHLASFVDFTDLTHLGLVNRNLAKKLYSNTRHVSWVNAPLPFLASQRISEVLNNQTETFPLRLSDFLKIYQLQRCFNFSFPAKHFRHLSLELSDTAYSWNTCGYSNRLPEDYLFDNDLLIRSVLNREPVQNSDQLRKIVEHMPYLETLNLHSFKRTLTEKDMNSLSSLSMLRQLKLNEINDSALNELTKKYFPFIEKIELGCSVITDDGICQLSKLVTLRKIYLLNSVHITDASLRDFSTLANLNTLMIQSVDSSILTNTGVDHLKNMTTLQHLTLSFSLITDEAFEHLSNLTLHSLDVTGTHITGFGLSYLNPLELSNLCLAICSNLTRVGYASLATFSMLESLNLSRGNLIDHDLVHLQGLSLLKILNIEECKHITPAGIDSLKSLQIDTLELEGCIQIPGHENDYDTDNKTESDSDSDAD